MGRLQWIDCIDLPNILVFGKADVKVQRRCRHVNSQWDERDRVAPASQLRAAVANSAFVFVTGKHCGCHNAIAFLGLYSNGTSPAVWQARLEVSEYGVNSLQIQLYKYPFLTLRYFFMLIFEYVHVTFVTFYVNMYKVYTHN